MNSIGLLTKDARLLFATRCSRMFAYGLISVILVLYLLEVGLKEWEVGLLLTLTLFGDTAISLWLTTTADRIGRRPRLIIGALLMALAGVAFRAKCSARFFCLPIFLLACRPWPQVAAIAPVAGTIAIDDSKLSPSNNCSTFCLVSYCHEYKDDLAALIDRRFVVSRLDSQVQIWITAANS